ncbi:MAG TPA: potassium channel family protein, partial [Alphaproteobacteria bacterium]|nr:potassium channel family protein [Alphaproteobacteria bacterium]
ELTDLIYSLAFATVMVATTVFVHFWGLLGLTALMGQGGGRLRLHEGRARQAVLIVLTVFGLFGLHTIEIWLYGALYSGLGEFKNFEEALYFSTTTFVTIGYGDIVLSPRWRLIAAIEGANGLILIGWSTAFLMTVTTRLRLLEHAWLDRTERLKQKEAAGQPPQAEPLEDGL